MRRKGYLTLQLFKFEEICAKVKADRFAEDLVL
jgi:hypothetical protein